MALNSVPNLLFPPQLVRRPEVCDELPALVSEFISYKTVEAGLSENTNEAYRRILAEFCSLLGKSPLKANEDDVQEYISVVGARDLSPSTIAQRVSCLREFFKHLQRDGLIRRNPMMRIRLPKQWKRMPKAVSESDVNKLLEAPAPRVKTRPGKGAISDSLEAALVLRDQAIIETLYGTGIRSTELISIRLMDLNLERRVLTVFGKGSKERLVPLGGRAIVTLRAYLAHGRPKIERTPSPVLFIGRNGDGLTRMRLWQILNERAERAGISHLSAHGLRHSTATHMLDHGADLRTIQTILGHSDITTTEIYTKVSQEHLRDVLMRCNPRWRNHSQMALFRAVLRPVPAICSDCQNPVVEGKTRCELHHRLNNEAIGRCRERKLQGAARKKPFAGALDILRMAQPKAG